MIFENILLGIIGFSFGVFVAGGVFTVFTAVGLVPRFIDKTGTGNKVRLYESMIVLGTGLGLIASVYPNFSKHCMDRICGDNMIIRNGILGIYGIFTGVYVGCLGISIAELFDAMPIMMRRVNIKRGVGILIVALALSKLIGSICYFFF